MSGKLQAKIIKADSAPLRLPAATEWPAGDVYPRPVDYGTLAESVSLNPYHAAALRIKAQAAVGLGYTLYRDEQADDALIAGWEAVWPEGFQREILSLALDLETFGMAYVEAVPGADGAAACYHVPAYTMWLRPTGYRQEVQLHRVEWPPYDDQERGIAHLGLYHPRADWYGLPDWITALNAMQLDANATLWNLQFFQNNCVPAWAILVEGGTLDETVEQQIADFFTANYKGVDNAHRALQLSGAGVTVKFQKLQDDSRDMGFAQLKQLARDEVVAAHGVPPRLLGIVTAGQLGGGGEMQSQLRFFREVLMAGRQRLWSRFLTQFLPAGVSLRFHEMDITDAETDATYYKELVAAGVLQPNEARAELGLEPVAGLDETALARLLGN